MNMLKSSKSLLEAMLGVKLDWNTKNQFLFHDFACDSFVMDCME